MIRDIQKWQDLYKHYHVHYVMPKVWRRVKNDWPSHGVYSDYRIVLVPTKDNKGLIIYGHD